MIQILPAAKRKPSGAERGNTALDQAMQFAQQFQQQQQQKQAFEGLGLDPRILQLPPEMQQMAVQAKLQQQNKLAELGQKYQGETETEGRDYNEVKNAFGEKFANIWRSSPVGGRTELLKHALDASSRGFNVEELLQGANVPQEQFQQDEISNEPIPQLKNGKVAEDFQWPDYAKRPQGYTPKEWNQERKTWRAENAPIFEKNNTQIKNLVRDELGIKKLEKINKSEKLPEGFERFLINPETGDFYGLAQVASLASPEAQEWVKEIARFQNRAKDAFGSRVTNFDLQSYMKQFPGLLNTPEGRTRILKMMKINNELDSSYAKSLQKVYQKYGLSGITQEEADKLARGFIVDRTNELEDEFLDLDTQIEEGAGQRLSGRMIDVIGPDGQLYEIDESQVEKLPHGYKLQ